MILLTHISKSYLKQPLFEELSLTFHAGEKVGIVGPNGGGKSTLLKIIAGIEQADTGTLDISKERIGYLAQQPEFTDYDSVESFLAAPDHKIKKVLSDVGLSSIATSTIITELSGGQKTRLGLAKVLLSNPTTLLLDEPTNHLDSSSLEWLERFIIGFSGIVIIVSHDRSLLNAAANRIIEIDSVNKEVNEFIGNYDDYITQKESLVEKREEAYSLQERKRKKMEEWIRHRQDIASARPNPAMGKQIQMMKRRLKREVLDQELVRPKEYKALAKLSISGEVPQGKRMLRVQDVFKALSNKIILDKVSFEIRGSERVLIKGNNGSGKTTLFKIITGKLDADSGSVTLGANSNVGYFAQEHEVLDLHKTVEEEFLSTERLTFDSKNHRSILGNFLFRNDDIYKKVKDLSLGQRVRLIFAKLVNQQNELLILDEPTNHLDIVSKESIEAALNKYHGAILIVSHDKYFLQKIGITRELTLKDGSLYSK
jgi:ATP-binding cassette subfamily F protein 3